jgi:hypothetical protein
MVAVPSVVARPLLNQQTNTTRLSRCGGVQAVMAITSLAYGAKKQLLACEIPKMGFQGCKRFLANE